MCRIGRDRRGEITARNARERARLIDGGHGLLQRLVRFVGRHNQPIELGLAIESPPLWRDERSVSARRRRLEGSRLHDRRPLVVGPHRAAADGNTEQNERGKRDAKREQRGEREPSSIPRLPLSEALAMPSA